MPAPGFNGELAPGDYWIDLFEKESASGVALFQAWRDERPQAVKVLKSEGPFVVDDVPDRTWVKFRVIGPTSTGWPKSLATQIGFPTRAGADVNSSSDTSTAADAQDAIDEETDGQKNFGLALIIGGAVLAVVVVVASIALEVTAARKAA